MIEALARKAISWMHNYPESAITLQRRVSAVGPTYNIHGFPDTRPVFRGILKRKYAEGHAPAIVTVEHLETDTVEPTGMADALVATVKPYRSGPALKFDAVDLLFYHHRRTHYEREALVLSAMKIILEHPFNYHDELIRAIPKREFSRAVVRAHKELELPEACFEYAGKYLLWPKFWHGIRLDPKHMSEIESDTSSGRRKIFREKLANAIGKRLADVEAYVRRLDEFAGKKRAGAN